MTTTPPPDDPVWADIRMRYEAGKEPVQTIAAAVGLSRITLSLRALREGWALRTRNKVSKAKRTAARARPPTTRETILRLKEMLQARVAQVEQELKDIGAGLDDIKTDRQIKSVNTLVRTIEKVLDLERKDKLKRRKALDDGKYFDDAQRRELAAKIERLEAERDGASVEPDPGSPRGGGTEPPVALLGETRPSATGNT